MIKESRIRINEMRETVIRACYELRAAEVDLSARRLGKRSNTPIELDHAVFRESKAARQLRIEIDRLHREEKILGLI